MPCHGLQVNSHSNFNRRDVSIHKNSRLITWRQHIMRHALGRSPELSVDESSNERLLSAVARTVRASRRVVCILGAGISTSAGIKDFRGSGRYDSVSKDGLSTMVLNSCPSKLLDTVRNLRSVTDGALPTRTHLFLKRLSEEGRLVRAYSQNIDGLEAKAGLNVEDPRDIESRCQRSPRRPPPDCLLLHGRVSHLRCTYCGHATPWSLPKLPSGTKSPAPRRRSAATPSCSRCHEDKRARLRAGKRRVIRLEKPLLRPDIILYGEEHPAAAVIGKLHRLDVRRRPDLVLVMGTSLAIPGVKAMLRELFHGLATGSRHTDSKIIFVNKSRPPQACEPYIDVWVQWDCDSWVADVDASAADFRGLSDQQVWDLVDQDGDGSGDEWLVEALLGERWVPADDSEAPTTRQLLVRWQGFPPSSDSWEPDDNIDKDLVEQWDRARNA